MSNRDIGTLQVGTEITIVDTTQETLLNVLILGALIAITVAGLAVWFSTYRALSPLEDATQAALKITRATISPSVFHTMGQIKMKSVN